MKYLLILTSIIGSNLVAAQNQTTLCNFGDQQRKIEVVYPDDEEIACEVLYTKYGKVKVLWSALSDTNYCQQKASAFIEKQQGWGWKCDSQIEGTDDAQTEPAIEESEPESAELEPVESEESEIK